MPIQPQPSATRPAFAVMLIGGGVLMLLAILSSLTLFVWSQTRPAGEPWNNIIVTIGMVFVELPTFVIGFLLVLIGWMRKTRSKRKTTLASS